MKPSIMDLKQQTHQILYLGLFNKANMQWKYLKAVENSII